MTKEFLVKQQQIHDVEANWNKTINFIPLKGEIIIYDPDDNLDYSRFKIGDGVTDVKNLPFSIGNTGVDLSKYATQEMVDEKIAVKLEKKENKIYKQNEAPTNAEEGALWLDMDEDGASSGGLPFDLDTTLTVEGAAADAKAVGDAIADIEVPAVLQGIGDSETSVMSQKAVSDAIASLTALPYGGSKEWLEKNGDKSQLYQINGYVWGYIESTGWTQSGTQFLIVTHEAYMTNNGGIPYLLRPSDSQTGIVFSYTEASGDSDTPVYDALPESANEGDIVAVDDRKYKASLNTVTVEHNAYDPNTAKFNWRLNSAGDEKGLGGSLLLDYAEVTYNTNFVVTIKGIEKLVKNYSSYLLVDYYDADKNRLGYVAGAAFYVPGGGGSDTLSNRFSGTLPVTFRLFAYSTGNVNNIETTKYVRIKLGIATDGTTISAADCEGLVVNFPSMNTTKSEVTWTDIGEYIPPVEAGWSATDETYSVIDTLSVSANSGDIAVYSADGYVYSYINGSAWSQTSKYDDAIGSMLVDGKSAYKYATEGGYTGTEAEFAKDINPDNIKSELSQIEAPTIVSSVTEMTDTTKHYVLDGYIYQCQITANGAQEWVNTGLSYMPIFKTDLIGVLTENNVIYLSDNSLPSGTYTLKYGDETYATIGTITVE